MNPKQSKNISTYVSQWLTNWMGFLALGIVGIAVATFLLGNVYEKGISAVETQLKRDSESIRLRMDSIWEHLHQLEHDLQNLADEQRLSEMTISEALLNSENSSSFATKVMVVWKNDSQNLEKMTVLDLDNDGLLDIASASIEPVENDALWATNGRWEFVDTSVSDGTGERWFTLSKPILSPDRYIGMVTIQADFQDMLDHLFGDAKLQTDAWLMVPNTGASPIGDIQSITGKSIADVAKYLNHNMSILAAQKGYARLRSQYFGPPIYVFQSDVMPDWTFYQFLSPTRMFADQFRLLIFFSLSMLFILFVSLITGVRFSNKVTKGLVRLTHSITASQTNELLTLSDDEESYEIITLTDAFNQTLKSLEKQNQKLTEESQRNNHLSTDISRFYTHIRMLNENNLRIDLFDFQIESRTFQFSTGLVTLYGARSQIHREMSAARFFLDYEVEPGLQSFIELVTKALSADDAVEAEFRAVGRDGATIWLRCWLKNGQNIGILSGALMDVTDEVNRRLAEKNRAIHDSITGLYNRNALEEIGGQAIERSNKGALVIFTYVSLAGYNEFETKYGMAAGNQYIQAFAKPFIGYLPPTDQAFRWLGSHFLVIINGMSTVEQFHTLCTHLIHLASNEIAEVEGIRITFPIHVGYAVAGKHGKTAAELLEYAAFAEHEITQKRMANPNLFDLDRYEAARRETFRKSCIPSIIAENKLYIVFQPIISLKDGELFGFEALSRSTCKDYPAISELIEDAEQAGFDIQLEKRMVYNALIAYEKRPKEFQNVSLFINTAPYATLGMQDYEEIRDRYFDSMNVVFEVVETRQIDPGEMAQRKEMVRATGAKFALDDFGSGYSNHIALLALEPDIIKIDRELIRDIDKNRRKQQLLEDIIGYARIGGTKVIAEGVETKEELRMLSRLGVDYVQGFLIARPSQQLASISTDIIAIIHQVEKPKVLTTAHIAGLIIRIIADDAQEQSRMMRAGFIVMRIADRLMKPVNTVIQMGLVAIAQNFKRMLEQQSSSQQWTHSVDDEFKNWLGASAIPSENICDFSYRLASIDRQDLTIESCLNFASTLDTDDQAVFAELLNEGLLDALSSNAWSEWMQAYLDTTAFSDPSASEWLRFMAHLVDSRSRHSIGHTIAAEITASRIAHMMNISWKQTERIRLATVMMGIGKFYNPISLIENPHTLLASERALNNDAIVFASDLLSAVELADLAAMLNPKRTKGDMLEALPEKDLNAAVDIIKVTDLITSLDENRSYRTPMTVFEIKSVLVDMMVSNELHNAVTEAILENLDELLQYNRKWRQLAQSGFERAILLSDLNQEKNIGGNSVED